MNGRFFEFLETAELTVASHLPTPNALLANSQVLPDLVLVGILKEVSFAFLDYLASNSQSDGTGSTSSVWEKALFNIEPPSRIGLPPSTSRFRIAIGPQSHVKRLGNLVSSRPVSFVLCIQSK
jgi:hypothetical protein